MAQGNISDAPLRPVRMGSSEAEWERRADGSVLLARKEKLRTPPVKLSERFVHWSAAVPERVFLAEQDSAGNWQRLNWGEALSKVRSIAQALIERGLSEERPVAILSENSIEHGLLSVACQMAGVPCAAISPSYSLLATDFLKLRQVLALATPGLVFAQDDSRYARAIAGAVPADVEVVLATGTVERGGKLTPFSSLLATRATADVDSAHAKVGPDTVAKLLFTSGSTGAPKGVAVTQRMMCANQQAIVQGYCFIEDEPLVLVDWLPWHHTFGGNNNLGMVINTGGSMYIDQGRPVPGLIDKTVRALRGVSPLMYMGVPKGLEMLLPHLKADRAMAESMFRNLKCTLFGGAAMPKWVMDAFQAVQVETVGERITNVNGIGSTDAGPSACMATWDVGSSPNVGLPVCGMQVKIVPAGGKLEMRYKGPAVLPYYWRDPERTRAAFDEEGFFKIGDAITWVDENDYGRGMAFNGRVAEDFKLASGTWVNVAALRERLIEGMAPCVRDAVITGHGGDSIGAMLFVHVDACRKLCRDLPPDAPAATVIAHPSVREMVQKLLDAQDPRLGGSERIERVVIELEHPSLDNGELTDKNSVSQRNVLDRRVKVVEELNAAAPSARTIVRRRA